MDDDDDFYGETDNSDYKIEQRSTERLLNDVKASGFRDGHQKLMEDEKHLQLGFDLSYPLMCRVAYLVGTIKSYNNYSQFTKGNTAFMSKLVMRLDLIEKYNYQLYLNWLDLCNYSKDLTVQPSSDRLIDILRDIEQKLTKFETDFLNLNTNDLETGLDLSQLGLTSDMVDREQLYLNKDVKSDLLEQEKVQSLNKLVDDIKFDF